MIRKRVSSLIASVLTAGSALVATGSMATAAPAGSESAATLAAEKAVLQKVVTSSNPQSAAQSLSSHDRALLDLATQHQTGVTTVTGSSAPAAAVQTQVNGMAVTAAAAGGCWWVHTDTEWYDLGINDGETWMTLNWCGNGSTITSYSVSNYGGRGKGGQSYDGVVATPSLNVGWEVRQAVEFNFDYFGSHAYPCNQIRGGASGLYSTRTTCNLN